jgi:hypothetical protein
MNRNSIVLAGAICTLIGVVHTGPANAQFLGTFEGAYLRGDLGWSWAKDAELVDKNFGLDGFIFNSSGTGPGVVNDIGSSYVLGIGMGMRLAPQFRGDIVYSYRGGYQLDDTDQLGDSFSGDVKSHSVMANLYWDIPITMSGFSPFIGGGVGWADNRMKDVSTPMAARSCCPRARQAISHGRRWRASPFRYRRRQPLTSSIAISTAASFRSNKAPRSSTTAHRPGRIPAHAANCRRMS